MANKKMVTRTVISSVVTLMTVNLETAEVENKEIELSGQFKNEKQILCVLEKNQSLLGETIKPVQVLDVKPNETIYGMSEQEFITLAKPMDKKRHFIED